MKILLLGAIGAGRSWKSNYTGAIATPEDQKPSNMVLSRNSAAECCGKMEKPKPEWHSMPLKD